MSGIEIGRLLRSGTTGFVVGCKVQQISAPSFGAMVRVPLEEGYQVYGLIYDIHIDDDGLVRQLITAENISEEVMRDNRENRTVPVEIGVLALGYEENGQIAHLLPPRPPLSLDVIYLCTLEEVVRFTGAGAGWATCAISCVTRNCPPMNSSQRIWSRPVLPMKRLAMGNGSAKRCRK